MSPGHPLDVVRLAILAGPGLLLLLVLLGWLQNSVLNWQGTSGRWGWA